MLIKPYRPEDCEQLKDMTITCFDGASSIDHNIERLFGIIDGKDWSWRKRRRIDEDIAANANGILVAEVEGALAGYISTRVDHETKIGLIPNLAVLPTHQKSGIGRALIDAAVAYLKEEGMKLVHIETLATNPVGQKFYPAYGFKEVSRQIHYVMPIEPT
jgi:ribosomal protein S18 acetylase RimI-like enzyme